MPEFNRAAGSHAAEKLIGAGTRFDGLFCFSDTLAFGAIYTLAKHGISIPEDVVVVGFDDIEEGKFSVPSFATISPNLTTASETILDIIASVNQSGGRYRGGDRVVPFTVVDRTGSVPS